MTIEPYMASNLVTVALLGAVASVVSLVARHRLWREAAAALWNRRKVAIVVVGIYLTIGLLDSLAWKSTHRLLNRPIGKLRLIAQMPQIVDEAEQFVVHDIESRAQEN